MSANKRRFHDIEKRALALEMRQVGIPLDVGQFATPTSLIVRQVDGALENTTFDLPQGASGYILSLRITVCSSLIGISEFDLKVPWQTSPIQWLPEPAMNRTDY
jgi:hypothetical protein